MTMFADTPSFWRDRLRASGIHLGLSLAIALCAALLVLGVWYPYPYREISGGRELFTLLVMVDVILGPLATLAIFNRDKTWPVLRRDLWVIGLLQLSALAYGLHTVYLTRPVHLVFEYNRFSVVHAIDIPSDMLYKAPTAIEPMPLLGPTLLSLRPFKSSAEMADATFADMAGLKLASRPDFWQPYALAADEIRKEAKPIATLITRFPDQANAIRSVVQEVNRKPDDLVYLPMIGFKSFWTVFLDPATAQIVAFMPLDSF
jgi:hypothetical protein